MKEAFRTIVRWDRAQKKERLKEYRNSALKDFVKTTLNKGQREHLLEMAEAVNRGENNKVLRMLTKSDRALEFYAHFYPPFFTYYDERQTGFDDDQFYLHEEDDDEEEEDDDVPEGEESSAETDVSEERRLQRRRRRPSRRIDAESLPPLVDIDEPENS